jgi:hypothetical protein
VQVCAFFSCKPFSSTSFTAKPPSTRIQHRPTQTPPNLGSPFQSELKTPHKIQLTPSQPWNPHDDIPTPNQPPDHPNLRHEIIPHPHSRMIAERRGGGSGSYSARSVAERTLAGRRRAQTQASIRRESSPWRKAHSRLSGSSGSAPSNPVADRASQRCFALIAGGEGEMEGWSGSSPGGQWWGQVKRKEWWARARRFLPNGSGGVLYIFRSVSSQNIVPN